MNSGNEMRNIILMNIKRITQLETKLDEISKNKLDNYPLLKDIKKLLDNINKVFKPK